MSTPHDFVTELVEKYGVTRQDLFVLSSENEPYNAGTPKDLERAAWFAKVYEQLGSPKVHLRDVHYQLVVRLVERPDGTPYEGTDKDWRDLLLDGSKKARDLGLVSPWAFVDQRTQAVYEYDEERERRDDEPDVLVPNVELQLPILHIPGWQIGWPDLDGETVPTGLSLQPFTVELWIEKHSDALNAEVLPVAEELGCRVLTGAGFQSRTAAADLVLRSIDDQRERVVLWLADADSSGESMAIATARHTEFLCRHWLEAHHPDLDVPRIVMDSVALTLDQVAGIEAERGREIPRSPDRKREEGRVELQALAAFVPGWVATELRSRLEEITDPNLQDDIDAWTDEAQAAINDEWNDETAESREALITLREKRDAILGRFDFTGLNNALQEIDDERSELEEDIQAIVDAFNPELPDLPESDLTIDHIDRDWLLDTTREYADQLNHYRRNEPIQRRRPPLELTEPTCANPTCNNRPPGRHRYCTDACRKRHQRAST